MANDENKTVIDLNQISEFSSAVVSIMRSCATIQDVNEVAQMLDHAIHTAAEIQITRLQR